jgi:hypothetical protein
MFDGLREKNADSEPDIKLEKRSKQTNTTNPKIIVRLNG